MLEKQWELPFDDEDRADEDDELAIGSAEDTLKDEENNATVVVARSGVSARQRRMSARRRGSPKNGSAHFTISGPELLQNRNRIYLRGTVSTELLTHKQVVQLSKKIKDGIWLQ